MSLVRWCFAAAGPEQTPPYYGAIFFLSYFFAVGSKYYENKSFTPLSLRHRNMGGLLIFSLRSKIRGGADFCKIF